MVRVIHVFFNISSLYSTEASSQKDYDLESLQSIIFFLLDAEDSATM